MDEKDFIVFREKLEQSVDKRIDDFFAQNQTIDNVKNTTLYGYRGLGTNQYMQYSNTDSGFTIGGMNGSAPTVGN